MTQPGIKPQSPGPLVKSLLWLICHKAQPNQTKPTIFGPQSSLGNVCFKTERLMNATGLASYVNETRNLKLNGLNIQLCMSLKIVFIDMNKVRNELGWYEEKKKQDFKIRLTTFGWRLQTSKQIYNPQTNSFGTRESANFCLFFFNALVKFNHFIFLRKMKWTNNE